ncbi:MAG: phosphate regulon transcriptional regulatory protein PhoB [Betaproteobacteria bacterium]|nr:MAG: phosphate regulon transcriptional regulatory protein PhoB [Betaproteobacteria bacterium]
MTPLILIVEDEPGIQEMIRFNLSQQGYDTQTADDGEQAWALLKEIRPAVVLLDWMLPGMSGLDLAKRIRADARLRDMPVIMLTARAEERDTIIGLDAGADDYLTKPFSPRELVARIKAVLRRRIPQLAETQVMIGSLQLDPVGHRVTGGGQTLALGPTEFRLLHFFMTHPERVYSRSQLLDQVWGEQVFVEERTVDVHIRRLRSALELTGHDSLIQTVRGSGYRISASEL